jgi:hypothetical protein
MNNLNYILYAILFLLVLNLYMGKKTESMTNLDASQAEIKQMIYDTYKIDFNAINSLSNIATKLQTEGLTTLPSNLNVTGNIKATTITNSGNIETDTLKTTGNIETVDITTDNINIKDIQLLKGDNNALRIQTNNGRIDIGSQNANYCNINTDKEKIAFNKPITDVSVWPFDDYIKIDEKASLITDAIKTVTNLNEFKAKFGTLDQLNRACIGKTYNGDGSWVKSIVSQTHQCESWPIRRALKIHGGFTQPAFTALISYTNP